MDRKSYGSLLQTLLDEYPVKDPSDPTIMVDQGIKQTAFERLCGLDRAHSGIIYRICSGMQQSLSPEILLAIADKLELTGIERRRFIEAATFVPTERIFAAQGKSPEDELNHVLNLLRTCFFPAYVCDVFGDVVAVNKVLGKLYSLDDEGRLAAARADPTGFNILNYIFNPIHSFSEMLEKTATGEDVLTSNMQFWRRSILLYRAEKYTRDLKQALERHPKFELRRRFRKYWLHAYEARDLDGNFERIYQYNHPEHGPLKYLATISERVTGFGELYLVSYGPSDAPTLEKFRELAIDDDSKRTGRTGIMRLSPWPLSNKADLESRILDKSWMASRPRWD